MKLTPEEAAAARARALAYEANMAVEGLVLTPEGRALADKIDAEGTGYEEGVQMVLDDLRKRGIVPPRSGKSDIAAE
ncbi:MAG: hypothetical protein IT548_06535 [Alphaproteobacteria bacterium]|nr:hypothetical protein [Alphaproteobacteria bacterium]